MRLVTSADSVVYYVFYLKVLPSILTTPCSSGILSTSQRSTWRRTTCETGWGWWRLIRKAMSCATSRSVKMMKNLMLMNEALSWNMFDGCIKVLFKRSHLQMQDYMFWYLLVNKKIHTEIECLVFSVVVNALL